MSFDIFIILLTSAVIYYTGKYFTRSSSAIGKHFNLSRPVKGATLDAISSSLPELMIALFAVLSFGQFNVGLSTIIGSALFNLLIISGVSVLLSPNGCKIEREIITRDAYFYLLAVCLLVAVILFFDTWHILMPLVGFIVYGFYIKRMANDTKAYRKSRLENIKEKIESQLQAKPQIHKDVIIALASVVIISTAAYFLTKHSISFAEIIGVPSVIIAFTVLAIATSFPDAVISWINAKEGHCDDAISNAIGSNVFDILIGLSIPLFIAIILNGPFEISFHNIESAILLMGATILTLVFLNCNSTLSKTNAWTMILIYISFLIYIIWLGFA